MEDYLTPALTSEERQPFYRSLYFQVLTAIAIGIAVGYWAPNFGASTKPLGDGFIKLIKMLIAPIIFCTVVTGIAGAGDVKAVGKTGGLALLYFEAVSTSALILGLILVNIVGPGRGMNVDVHSLDSRAIASYSKSSALNSTTDFLLHVIPSTFFDAFASGEILQVLLLAILFGFALQRLGPTKDFVLKLIHNFSTILFAIVGMIMRLAPVGAFGAMAFTIGAYGLKSLLPLAKLMLLFYATCLVFIFVVLGVIAHLHGFNILRFLRFIREELLIVLGTSSSEAALPKMMTKMELLGAGRRTVSLVIPTGYSFNLDGTSIYLTMASVFIAQATNTAMTLMQQITLLAVLLLTSKGAAGVTGSGFVVLAATLSAVSTVPVAGLALILGIDRFMSEARALTNVIGNGVATLVVARWTGDLDNGRLHSVLHSANPASIPVEAEEAVAAQADTTYT